MISSRGIRHAAVLAAFGLGKKQQFFVSSANKIEHIPLCCNERPLETARQALGMDVLCLLPTTHEFGIPDLSPTPLSGSLWKTPLRFNWAVIGGIYRVFAHLHLLQWLTVRVIGPTPLEIMQV